MTLQPSGVDVPQATLDDLAEQLSRTRWPGELGGPGWWVTGTIGSSFRIYRDWALGMADRPETWRLPGRNRVPAGVQPRPLPAGERLQLPVAVALFRERWPREWAERVDGDLRRFTETARSGHFPALEEPELLVQDLRAFFRGLR
jgi:pimeloyl-ACP methyl ester carboxylesterase